MKVKLYFSPVVTSCQSAHSRNKLTQDVLVPEQHSVVDLCLSEPGLLIP